MKKIMLCFLLCGGTYAATAQSKKIELYDLVKKLVTDSTGYENIGDWGIGKPAKYPVRWKADKLEMSDDTSINFFRMGTADITVKGKSFMKDNQPVKWTVMLKGPRMGYSSFSIISSPRVGGITKLTLDSLFENIAFAAKLLKSCGTNGATGFYYYQLKLPKKDVVFLKLSWSSLNGNAAIRIDGFDNYSQYSAKLNCPGR